MTVLLEHLSMNIKSLLILVCYINVLLKLICSIIYIVVHIHLFFITLQKNFSESNHLPRLCMLKKEYGYLYTVLYIYAYL